MSISTAPDDFILGPLPSHLFQRDDAERAQWDDGDSVLAVAPGGALGYERNSATNRYLADDGIEVVPVVGSERRPPRLRGARRRPPGTAVVASTAARAPVS